MSAFMPKAPRLSSTARTNSERWGSVEQILCFVLFKMSTTRHRRTRRVWSGVLLMSSVSTFRYEKDSQMRFVKLLSFSLMLNELPALKDLSASIAEHIQWNATWPTTQFHGATSAGKAVLAARDSARQKIFLRKCAQGVAKQARGV